MLTEVVNPSPNPNDSTSQLPVQYLNVPPRGPITDRNAILRWMQNVNTTESLLKSTSPGREIEAIPQYVNSGNVWKMKVFNHKL